MKWYKNLYVGSQASEKRRQIIWKTRHKKLQQDVFLLTLPTNEKNQLDIISANLLLQPYFKKQEISIVGIAIGKDEAIEVLIQLVQDVYIETGQSSIREYLIKQDWK